jgi:hypothetical protein
MKLSANFAGVHSPKENQADSVISTARLKIQQEDEDLKRLAGGWCSGKFTPYQWLHLGMLGQLRICVFAPLKFPLFSRFSTSLDVQSVMQMSGSNRRRSIADPKSYQERSPVIYI